MRRGSSDNRAVLGYAYNPGVARQGEVQDQQLVPFSLVSSVSIQKGIEQPWKFRNYIQEEHFGIVGTKGLD